MTGLFYTYCRRAILCILIMMSASPATAVNRSETRFGIVYTGWHCLVTRSVGARPFSVTSEALAGRRPWGQIPDFHFWGEPKAGYYCLSERPDVLRWHAMLLRQAGVDFIVFDATNAPRADWTNEEAAVSVMQPFERLLDEWKRLDQAPKVVPWAPAPEGNGMLQWMARTLETVPDLAFQYKGKPLILAVENASQKPSATALQELEEHFTIRSMWGLVQSAEPIWSFLSACKSGFLASKAAVPCEQRRVKVDGQTEQIAVAPAYQETYISDKRTAVPKFGGRTFVEQLQTAFLDPPEIAIIATWNEWMAQRFCLDRHGQATDRGCSSQNDHWPDGSKVFVDQYDADYNKDFEPAKGRDGDRYYRLLAQCIELYRRGQMCASSLR